MRLRLDSVSWVLIVVTLIATAVVLGIAQPVSAACQKFCGFCGDSCTQRNDPACTGGDKCLVKSCQSTWACHNMLICGVTCQGNPNCCNQPGYVDDCGSPGGCVYLRCPCLR
jgi:hypothetical protein